jgi:hypothetical protein
MAELFFSDLVRESSHGTGTGPLALAGPIAGHRSFAATVPPGARFHYAIAGVAEPAQWETGEGSIGAGGALERSPIASSAGGSAVDFGAGLKIVALTVCAAWFQESQEALGSMASLAGAALDGTTGIVEQTGPDSFAKRTIGTSAAASVLTRGDGDGRYLLSAAYTAGDVLAKIATVDGAGSGVDADLLDGLHGAAFAQLSGAAFTGGVSTTMAVTVPKSGFYGIWFDNNGNQLNCPDSPAWMSSHSNVMSFGSYNGNFHWRAVGGNVERMRLDSGGLTIAGFAGASSELQVGGTKVVGARAAGWSAPTGTASRASFDTATAGTAELAKRLKALIDDLIAHGLIGA